MSIWSKLIQGHLAMLEESCSPEVIDFMLLESGLSRDRNGIITADSFSDLSRYLDTLGNYLGLLYRERAERIFSDIIEKSAHSLVDQTDLAADFRADLEHKARLAKNLESLNRDLLHAKENAEMASRTKSLMLATMSDEIRTPMNDVIACVQQMQGTRLSKAQKALLSRISRSSGDLLNTINGILDLSKIEAGHLQLTREAFDIQQLIRDACDLNRSRADEKGVQLAVEVEAGTPDWVLGDPVRVRQVMMNLIANAIRFTSEGAVNVEMGYDQIDDTRYNIILEISDTGIGQGDGPVSGRYGGASLGLILCKHLVELMEGYLEEESAAGKGTSFIITLPFTLVRPDELA